MPKSKFYAVRKGRVPGIYPTWEECSAQVTGFNGAVYKSFETLREAQTFMQGEGGYRPSPKQQALFAAEPAPAPSTVEKPEDDLKQVLIYTDGGCISNPGPGGYGVVLLYGSHRRELSGGFRLTTNNRMELMACIAGLESLKEPVGATVYSDSRYLVNAMTSGAARRWQRSNWERKDGPVPNADLWQRLLAAADRHEVSFEWVRGHVGNPENERCDRLATAAAMGKGLVEDVGYENGVMSEE